MFIKRPSSKPMILLLAFEEHIVFAAFDKSSLNKGEALTVACWFSRRVGR
jgi:uncharacterized membrane protein YGL010W